MATETDVAGGVPTVLDVLIDLFRDVEGELGMPIQVQKAAALKKEGKTLLVYAHSGVGKTHLLGTLPVGKTLIVDIDQGIETLAETEHDVVRPESLGDLDEVWEGLNDGSLDYRFVSIDSLSELERLLQTSRKRAKSKRFLSLKEYGESSELVRELVRKFRDLRSRGITVIFTALETLMDIQVSESETLTKSVPMLTKRFSLEAAGLMDMVARLTMNPNTGERELHFAGGQEFIAKTRVHAVEAVEAPDLTGLFRRIYGITPHKEDATDKKENTAKDKPKDGAKDGQKQKPASAKSKSES